jgi:hypothetical protein
MQFDVPIALAVLEIQSGANGSNSGSISVMWQMLLLLLPMISNFKWRQVVNADIVFV